MRSLIVVFGLISLLGSNGSYASDFNWFQCFQKEGTNHVVEVITIGGTGYNSLTDFLNDTTSGNLVCGQDDATQQFICQIVYDSSVGYLQGFEVKYNFKRHGFEGIYSATYSYDGSIGDQGELSLETEGAGRGYISGVLQLNSDGMIVGEGNSDGLTCRSATRPPNPNM